MAQAKSQELQELVRKMQPAGRKLGEEWGFGGVRTVGN